MLCRQHSSRRQLHQPPFQLREALGRAFFQKRNEPGGKGGEAGERLQVEHGQGGAMLCMLCCRCGGTAAAIHLGDEEEELG
jgi:hypothetical protein